MVQLLEQMIVYQHDKFNCPCSRPSFLSKADCDGLKPLFADSTLSALHGVCRLSHGSFPERKILLSHAGRSQCHLQEQMHLREGTAGHS